MESTTMDTTQPILWEEPGFAPADSPKPRAQTLATNSLLREPIDMHNFRNTRIHSARTELPLDFAAYIEHARAALESQRASFERERKAFAQERKLWDTERCILRSQIAKLEAAVGKKDDEGLSSFARASQGRGSAFPPSFTGKALPLGNTDRFNGASNGRHVWEGPIPKPTRVFSEESVEDINYSCHGNGCDKREPSDAALRERSHTITRNLKIGDPTGGIDSTLDGVVLKSSRSPPDTAKKVVTDSQESPLGSSIQNSDAVCRSNQRVSVANIGAPEANLTKDAGHTPMVVIGSELDTQTQSSVSPDDTSKEDAPLAPQTTLHGPSGEQNSYFFELDEDPELTGPLGLKNDETADNAFLHELDERLLDEAKKIVSGPFGPKHDDDVDEDDWKSDMDEPEPELRFRKTSNFGAPFGSTIAR